MAFVAAGYTAHPIFGAAQDICLDAAWTPSGKLWVLCARNPGSWEHQISEYDPDADTWTAGTIVVPSGAASSPLAYSHEAARVVINKNGLALLVWGSGSAGAGRTWYRTIDPSFALGTITELLDIVGSTVDGASFGGSLGAAVRNECTDFTLVFRDSLGHDNISAIDLRSDTLVTSNRREVVNILSLFGSGFETYFYRRAIYISPVDDVLTVACEVNEPAGSPRPFYLVVAKEGVYETIHLPVANAAYASGPDRFYSIRPEMVGSNINDSTIDVIWQANTIGNGSSGTSATYYQRFTDGVAGPETVVYDISPKVGSDARSICLDGHGNVFLFCDKNAYPDYTDGTGTPGIGCYRRMVGSDILEDMGVVGQYPTGEAVETVAPQMRPRTEIVMPMIRKSGVPVWYNKDDTIAAFVTEEEAQQGLGECLGVSVTDVDHDMFVFDERAAVSSGEGEATA